MNFAVLGTDPDMLALIAAALADAHRIVWLGDVRAEDETTLRSWISPDSVPSTDWETLLDHATADAVLVGRGRANEELRAEQLRRLVADAVPLLVAHPAGVPLLIYYELDMVQRETGGILRHYHPLVGHPVVGQLAHWVRQGHETIGAVHRIMWTRPLADTTRQAVLDGFARDAELLAAVAGDIRQVSALGPQDSGASYASLQVQMTAATAATLHWSLTPAATPAGGQSAKGCELTLVGERGTVCWSQESRVESQESRVERQESRAGSRELASSLQISAVEDRIENLPPFNAAAEAIRQLAAAIEHPTSNIQHPASARPGFRTSTWDKATQAMEVADAVELSLQKNRTIEVHQQQLTEELSFRGTMAAVGCGLLLFGLLFVFVVGLFGESEEYLEWILDAWLWILLAILAAFLLLQVVPFLFSKSRRRQRRE